MTVEACKAGKDVYVEKPICVSHRRRPQDGAGRAQVQPRGAGGHHAALGRPFPEGRRNRRSGELGKVTFVRTWNYGNTAEEGIGNPPDGDAAADARLGYVAGPGAEAAVQPEPLRRRSGDKYFSNFRWFWDYAGGMMTDWGVHRLDIVQMAFDEVDAHRRSPRWAASTGLKDNRETPDTLQVTYEYPGFIATYENRNNNAQSMFDKSGGILFRGIKAHAVRGSQRIQTGAGEGERRRSGDEEKSESMRNMAHWANFLECVRTREKPNSDIEKCLRSTLHVSAGQRRAAQQAAPRLGCRRA